MMDSTGRLSGGKLASLQQRPDDIALLAAVVGVDGDTAESPDAWTIHDDVPLDADDVLRLHSDGFLEQVGSTTTRKNGRRTDYIREWRVKPNVAPVVTERQAQREAREGWCVDPDCVRTSIVNDGEPRCKCGAALRDEVVE